jgi:hypothetical protein
MAVVFFAAAPMILFYSEGYRFDFQQKKLLKTGGFYVKTSVPAAEVYIDQKYINKTSTFITYDYLAQNLLPKNHDIKIQKTGYHTWEKTLAVKEKMVAQANVTLFPDSITFSPAEQKVKNAYTFPNQNILILAYNDGSLYAYENQQKNLILAPKLANTIKISEMQMSPDSRTIIVKAIESKTLKQKYYLLSTIKENTALAEIKNMDKTTRNIFFYANNLIYFDQNSKVYRQALDLQRPTAIINTAVDAFTIDGDNIYYLQKKIITRENLLTTFKENISIEPIETNSKYTYGLFAYGGNVFLLENKKNIYWLNDKTKILKKIITADSEIKYYPQFDKILFTDGSEVWMFFLNDYESPFFVKANTLIPITKFLNVDNLNWIGGDYFSFIDSKGKIEISEIDNRGGSVNYFQASDIDASELWFDRNAKSLYVLSGNTLSASPKIIP